MRIFILVLKPHPQSILRGVVFETNVAATASFNQLAKETHYSRGSFARNSSRQKTPTTESPPSVKQSLESRTLLFRRLRAAQVSVPVDLHFLPHASTARQSTNVAPEHVS